MPDDEESPNLVNILDKHGVDSAAAWRAALELELGDRPGPFDTFVDKHGGKALEVFSSLISQERQPQPAEDSRQYQEPRRHDRASRVRRAATDGGDDRTDRRDRDERPRMVGSPTRRRMVYGEGPGGDTPTEEEAREMERRGERNIAVVEAPDDDADAADGGQSSASEDAGYDGPNSASSGDSDADDDADAAEPAPADAAPTQQSETVGEESQQHHVEPSNRGEDTAAAGDDTAADAGGGADE